MKKILVVLSIFILITACSTSSDTRPKQNIQTNEKAPQTLQLKVGDHTYTIEMEDNKSVSSLTSLLPLELYLEEYNGNEYYCQLDNSLNPNDEEIDEIKVGDVMLYSGNTIVIFYKSFKPSYQYTKLGRIKDPSNLEQNLKNAEEVVLKKVS